jgi:hypothetical protein
MISIDEDETTTDLPFVFVENLCRAVGEVDTLTLACGGEVARGGGIRSRLW